MIKTEAYANDSVFCGWAQYYDEKGDEWRRETEGQGLYRFYFREKSQDSFIHVGVYSVKGKTVLEKHNQFLDQWLNEI